MDIGKILATTVLKSVQQSKIDGILGVAIRSIDMDRFEDEYENRPLGGDILDVTPEAVNVNNLDDRLKLLISVAKTAALQMPLRQKAAQITASCQGSDKECLIDSIFSWVKNNVHYREEFLEQFVSPTLYASGYAVADCDDFTMLIASLLLASGVGVEEGKPLLFRVTGKTSRTPSHVYPMAPLNNEYIALDATLDQPAGYDVSEHGEVKVKDYHVY